MRRKKRPETMRVTFTATARSKAGETFEAGRSYDLPVDDALYWIGRSAAVVANDDEATEEDGDAAG